MNPSTDIAMQNQPSGTNSPGTTGASRRLSESPASDSTATSALELLTESARRIQAEASELLERLRPRIDAAAVYAKDEPIKSVLIAAACGALAMGLLTLMSRPPARPVKLRRRMRRMAQSAADSAARMAHDTIDRASSASDTAIKSTRQAAGNAFDGLSETVQNWREKAAPLVERFQPQIDTVTAYARKEPAKSALLVATAGAVVAGLLALANQDDDDY